eukprot:gene11778-15759_t
MSNKSAPMSAELLLKKLRKLEGNMTCPNCGTVAQSGIGFGNVCVKYKTFVCDLCKTSHQAISHRVKSISMSNWTMEEVRELTSAESGGNDAARHIWLSSAPKCGSKYPGGGTRPKPGDNIEIFKRFVIDCYERGMFRATTPFEPDANEAQLLGTAKPASRVVSKPSSTTSSPRPPATSNSSTVDFFDMNNGSDFSVRETNNAQTASNNSNSFADFGFDTKVSTPSDPFSGFNASPSAFSSTTVAAPVVSSTSNSNAFTSFDSFNAPSSASGFASFDAFGSSTKASVTVDTLSPPNSNVSGFDFFTAGSNAVTTNESKANLTNQVADLFGDMTFTSNVNNGVPSPLPTVVTPPQSAPVVDPFGMDLLQPMPLSSNNQTATISAANKSTLSYDNKANLISSMNIMNTFPAPNNNARNVNDSFANLMPPSFPVNNMSNGNTMNNGMKPVMLNHTMQQSNLSLYPPQNQPRPMMPMMSNHVPPTAPMSGFPINGNIAYGAQQNNGMMNRNNNISNVFSPSGLSQANGNVNVSMSKPYVTSKPGISNNNNNSSFDFLQETMRRHLDGANS